MVILTVSESLIRLGVPSKPLKSSVTGPELPDIKNIRIRIKSVSSVIGYQISKNMLGCMNGNLAAVCDQELRPQLLLMSAK
jgi:hypothetical protein